MRFVDGKCSRTDVGDVVSYEKHVESYKILNSSMNRICRVFHGIFKMSINSLRNPKQNSLSLK